MERLGSDIRRTLAVSGMPEAGAMTAIVRAWPQAVGAAIARCAWPQRLGRDGTLRVAAVSSTWAYELDRLAPEILPRLQAALGEDDRPARLRFVLGPVPGAPAVDPDEPASRLPQPAAPERQEAARLAAAIEDDELRELVVRAAAASLAQRRAGQSGSVEQGGRAGEPAVRPEGFDPSR